MKISSCIFVTRNQNARRFHDDLVSNDEYPGSATAASAAEPPVSPKEGFVSFLLTYRKPGVVSTLLSPLKMHVGGFATDAEDDRLHHARRRQAVHHRGVVVLQRPDAVLDDLEVIWCPRSENEQRERFHVPDPRTS
jgi:hypothetical protein